MKPLTFIFKFLIFALGVLFAVFLVKSASAVELDRRHAARGLYQGCPGELAEASGLIDDHPLPDVTRSGKLPIKVFLCKNPEAQDRAFEYTAFIKDQDDKGPARTVYLQIVASAPSEKILESARPAFMEPLANF